MVETAKFGRPFSILKFLQLSLGLIIFGLYFHYHGSVEYSIIFGSDSENEAFVRRSFASTAIIGYPFIIVLVTILSICFAGDSVEMSILHFMLNIVGFMMYLVIGSLIAHYTSKHNSTDAVKSVAGLCIINSFFFLCDIIIYLLNRFKR